MKVVLSFGSNLGDSFQILESAIASLSDAVTVTHVSTFIETEPLGGPVQPNYLNAVVIAETQLEPMDLLRAVNRIEHEFGRVRNLRWGPRTLDIDIIKYGELEMNTDELQLPHPRAHERKFVLEPWLEIDPEASLPGLGSASRLLANISQE